MNEELKEALKIVAEAGLEIRNSRGGYMGKDDTMCWFHQACYRSTYTAPLEEVIESFLDECGIAI